MSRVARRVAFVALAALAGCGSDEPPPAPVATAGPAPTATPAPAPADPLVAQVWGAARPGRAAARLRRHPAVASVTTAGRRVVLLRSSSEGERVRAGFAIPLDVLAIRPRAFARAVPADAREPFRRLRGDRALLSQTAARLRGVEAGAVLRLTGGRRLRVAAVVPDDHIRRAEVAVAGRGGTDRPVLLAVLREPVPPGELARRAGGGAAARVLESGPAGPARPADLKAAFGEPAVGLPYGDDWVRLDPAFVRRHIVSRRVPVLGEVTCHRAMVPRLRRALAEVRRRGLAGTIDPGDYAGCYAPRRIRPGGALSLHAWGLAVDLNASANPFGGRSRQDRRLVRIMVRHGFAWGGDWPTTPDPMHFELRSR